DTHRELIQVRSGTTRRARAGLRLLTREYLVRQRASVQLQPLRRARPQLRDEASRVRQDQSSGSAIRNSNASTDPTIQFCDVSLRIGDKTLVEDLSFDVARGETLVLLGRSGSGKTTSLKLMNRLLSPTSGEVRVEGKSTAHWDPIELRRHIGYVIQE